MSNVTQHTNMKKWLYALITFLFLVLAIPIQAQECKTSNDLLVQLTTQYGDAVSIANVYSNQVATNIIASYNSYPPESFLEGDTVVIYKHKDHPEATLMAIFKGNCLVEAFMLPTVEAHKFLPTGA